jgi:hypothetical protein
MPDAQRLRTKMIRGLLRALDDEAQHVRRYTRVGTACTGAGAFVFAIGLLLSMQAGAGAWWFMIAGLAAGVLIGLGIFFNSSVEQWPVTREFLDVEALREAGRREEGQAGPGQA